MKTPPLVIQSVISPTTDSVRTVNAVTVPIVTSTIVDTDKSVVSTSIIHEAINQATTAAISAPVTGISPVNLGQFFDPPLIGDTTTSQSVLSQPRLIVSTQASLPVTTEMLSEPSQRDLLGGAFRPLHRESESDQEGDQAKFEGSVPSLPGGKTATDHTANTVSGNKIKSNNSAADHLEEYDKFLSQYKFSFTEKGRKVTETFWPGKPMSLIDRGENSTVYEGGPKYRKVASIDSEDSGNDVEISRLRPIKKNIILCLRSLL